MSSTAPDIALVDCNNFFVSCERVFDPSLLKRPVCVLSSNDGCIIARSAEVKALGVPMGAPLFQWRDFLERHRVILRSSNFALYADLSNRVMQILKEESAQMEVYSVDEAFCEIEDPQRVRQKILQWTGIPVSIGMAKTKTLAKVANHQAKKGSGICEEPQIEDFPIEDVWGIGRRLSERFAKRGIFTVGQLLQIDERSLNVNIKRTILELKGTPCFPLSEEVVSKQSIMTSRTFGVPITTKEELVEAVSAYATRAGEKVRHEGLRASWLQLLVRTKSEMLYRSVTFSRPTDYTPELIEYALACLDDLYRTDCYKKAGILLGGLVEDIQNDLFAKPLDEQRKRAQICLDSINSKYGKEMLSYASAGIERPWKMQRNLCSPAYTTQWDEILKIQL